VSRKLIVQDGPAVLVVIDMEIQKGRAPYLFRQFEDVTENVCCHGLQTNICLCSRIHEMLPLQKNKKSLSLRSYRVPNPNPI
jgi:hypothetical protein